ncbi:hypothetical protein [Paracoccus beibuensis]|uniref:hypothetical protein n=1 Tax=Paracoccus beibuensis TaxID=547602 RepID=UPI00223FFCF1|nr:hypothetical protein [Paracoccus beibuensis]
MIAYWIAAAGLLVLILIHLTVGEKEVVRPLLASREFKDDTKYVLFLCWHLVTLVMAGAAAGYVAAAMSNEWRDFALAGTILIALLALWSFTVVIWKRQRHRDMPQWIAFAAVALLGLAGHVTT